MSSASYVKRKQTNFVSMRQRALVFIPLSTSRIDAARCCSWLVAFYMDTHGNRQTAIWPSIHPTWFYIRILLWTQYTYLGIHNMDVWVSVSDRYTLNIKKTKEGPIRQQQQHQQFITLFDCFSSSLHGWRTQGVDWVWKWRRYISHIERTWAVATNDQHFQHDDIL